MIVKKDFSCVDCGKCCQIMTKVDSRDIERIEMRGHRDFTMKNPMRSSDEDVYLKRNGEDCIFLGWKGDKSFCKIHPFRPQTCRDYPFFEKDEIDVKDCLPEYVLGSSVFRVLR